MKKSCDGCKAFSTDYVSKLHLWKCELDYKIDEHKGIPFEECPKPKTYQRFFELKELKEQNNLTNEELVKWKAI